MSLKDFDFKIKYSKSEDDISADFYLPCMRNSKSYNRISGYFRSTLFIIAWEALREFVNNGGKMKLICSPYISNIDQEAATEGYLARESSEMYFNLNKEIEEIFQCEHLVAPARVLACLVAEGIIDIKIAVGISQAEPDLKRLFHEKSGIFIDAEGNKVAFEGSMNETYSGLASDGNIEAVSVFVDWEDKRDKERVDTALAYFDKLWNAQVASMRMYDFPESAKEILKSHVKNCDWEKIVDEIIEVDIIAEKWKADKKKNGRKPRPHQVNALETWNKNNRRGIFEHATGSGKTYTAICAIRDALNRNESVLVLVPSKDLLYQWNKELRDTLSDINIFYLLCGDGNNEWKQTGVLSAWSQKNETQKRIIIAIMDTATTNIFLKNIIQGEHLFVVADEVHRLGSEKRRNFFKIYCGARLGLSATPIRYGDPEGTNAIFNYFNGIIPPPYTLYDAIKSDVLTRYFYFPQKLKLDEAEQEQWNEVSKEISEYIAKNRITNTKSFDNEYLKMLLIKRSRIVKNANGKLNLTLQTLKKYYMPNQKWIVYCDNIMQMTKILELLVSNGYDAYEYHSEMVGDREQTLSYFESNGGILVSIKCLDEGVDIPSTTHALILASSKNPREFIQRRGRILRKASNKHFAYLFDTIVVPNNIEHNNELSIIEGELARAIQFGEWSENKGCITELRNIAIDFGIDYKQITGGGYEDDEE